MKIISVNRQTIFSNRKNHTREHPIRVSTNKSAGKKFYTDCFEFEGKGRVIYDPDNPLKCGATVWIEVDDGD